MLAGISQVHSAVDFFLNAVLIRSVCSQIFELCALSKGLLHVFMYCDFVLRSVHETDTYSAFSTVTSRTVSLQGTSKAYGVSALTPYIISINNDVMCTICCVHTRVLFACV
jgi:hypothetical protein